MHIKYYFNTFLNLFLLFQNYMYSVSQKGFERHMLRNHTDVDYCIVWDFIPYAHDVFDHVVAKNIMSKVVFKSIFSALYRLIPPDTTQGPGQTNQATYMLICQT